MENPWLSSARASALLPVPPPAGVKPSSVPPDPPDPASSFPLTHFPPLSSSSPKSQKQSKLGVSRTLDLLLLFMKSIEFCSQKTLLPFKLTRLQVIPFPLLPFPISPLSPL
ncbi:hypothetical protein YC2023_048682 [Brassica napus]